MKLAALFFLATLALAALTGWCIFPAFRKTGSRKPKLRISIGVLIIVANFALFIQLPALLVLRAFGAGENGSNFFIAVTMFLRTVPAYVENIVRWRRDEADLIRLTHKIRLDTGEYTVSQTTACMRRKAFGIDKLMAVVPFDNFPTSANGFAVGHIGERVIVVTQSHFCSMIGRIKKGPLKEDFIQAQLIDGLKSSIINYQNISSEVMSLDRVPARSVIPLEAMFPLTTQDEASSIRTMPFVKQLRSGKRIDDAVLRALPDAEKE